MPQVTDDFSIPHHVAIVMDGNGRWAKRHFLPRLVGHHQGVDVLRQVVRWAQDKGVRVLTVFAFSSENWRRPPDEVSGLMALVIKALAGYVPEMRECGVRIHFPGQRVTLAPEVQQALQQAEIDTAHNDRLVLNICFNYGGRWDVVQAAQTLVARGEPVTEEGLSGTLALAHVPDPDLLIRTGGEQRLSNFLLWQAAYAELFFSDKWWPEFDEAEFDRALLAYAQRERRFGRISEQL